MQNGAVSLSDYQLHGYDKAFHGNASGKDVQDLVKALEAGQLTGSQAWDNQNASGTPLKVESLDKTLKLITFKESDIKLWKEIPKAPAYSTAEEYNQLVSYGSESGGFTQEGELPQEEDSKYVRRAQLVKFMGVTKSVTHPMSLVNVAHGPVIQREIQNGTLYILRKLNKALHSGDSNIIPEEFNGIYTQHRDNDAFSTLDQYMDSEVVIDMRGSKLGEEEIEDAAEAIVENYGLGTTLFTPPRALSNFVKSFYGNKFIQPNTPAVSAGVMGQNVRQFESQYGSIDLVWDVFMNKMPTKTTTSPSTSSNAPSAVTPDGTTPIAVIASDASSKFAAGDAADYFYAVSAVNRYGESAIAVCGGATTVAAGNSIDLKFAAGGGNAPTGYVIYRSNKDAASASAATFYPLFKVSLSNLSNGYDGGAAGIIRDRNRWMPNTDSAFLIQNNDEVHAFRQLAPLMKMDLAILSPAYRFMVLMYGTPLLYAPKKMVRFINIGEA